MEPARRVRPRRARPAAVGGAGAVRVERLHLADRVAADGPRPDEPLGGRRRTTRTSAGCTRSWPRTGRFAATSCESSSGEARCSRASSTTGCRASARPPLVRQPPRRPHAHDPAPAGARSRSPDGAGGSGSGISRERGIHRPGARPDAGPGSACLDEQRFRALGVRLEKGRLLAHPDATDGPIPDRVDPALAVRPPDPRPRPHRGAVGLLLPARDVRHPGQARVRLLRPAAARGRPPRRAGRAGRRPQEPAP